MPNTIKLRFWTGPAYIEDIGRTMDLIAQEDADVSDIIVGTEHIHCTVTGYDLPSAAWNLQVAWRILHLDRGATYPDFPYWRSIETIASLNRELA